MDAIENMAQLPEQFFAARRDEGLVVLEGFHVVKHALRFEADFVLAVTGDRADVLKLCAHHAPESATALDALMQDVDADVYARLAPRPPRTGVIAIARRPVYTLTQMADVDAPIVVVDDARDLDNLGACVRVAAAFGAAGVIAVGQSDAASSPWKPACLRGAAGLHFVLPVLGVTDVDVLINFARETHRSMYAFDERGEDVMAIELPRKSFVVFGSERAGVSDAVKAVSTRIVRLPMRDKVSSLNLATSVAAGLYGVQYT